MWSDVGRRLGIDCAPSRPDRIGDSEMLLVERYDREVDGSGEVVRLHQEDFCQALGIDGDHKYQREQGPGLADCFELVRRTCRTPGAELPKLLDAWALSFVAANHDAHGKNFSLLYRASGTEFAPVYDVLSTLAYRGIKPMDRKMAMHVGGEYRLEWVRRRHLERLLSDAGLGSAASRRRLRSLARRAPAAIDAAAHDLRRERWWHAHMDNVVELGHRRAKALLADIVDAAP
jgi:serine/threonine-protein kinase HipA